MKCDALGDVLRVEDLRLLEEGVERGTRVAGVVGYEFGRDGARLEHADAHVAPGDLLPKRFREPVHAELRHVVHRVVRHRSASCLRRDVHDVGDTPITAADGRQQVRQRRIRHVQQPLLIDGDHALPVVDVRAIDRSDEHQSRVVDKDVDTSEPVGRCLDGGLGLPTLREVGFDRERGAAITLDAAHKGAETFFPAGDEHDGRSELRESACGRLTDPAAGPRYDGHGFSQLPVHRSAPLASVMIRSLNACFPRSESALSSVNVISPGLAWPYREVPRQGPSGGSGDLLSPSWTATTTSAGFSLRAVPGCAAARLRSSSTSSSTEALARA
jgi:hypothetical protein